MHYPLQTQMDIIIAFAVIYNFIMMSFDDEVSLTTHVDDQDEDDIEQDEDNIEQDRGPSTEQEDGHQTAMGQFQDGITELIWTYRNHN